MFKKLLILVLLITPVWAYAPEFCSPSLESGCVDYEAGAINYFITQKSFGKYSLKIFSNNKDIKPRIIYYPNKESMYQDFEENWHYILKGKVPKNEFYTYIEKYDKVKEPHMYYHYMIHD